MSIIYTGFPLNVLQQKYQSKLWNHAPDLQESFRRHELSIPTLFPIGWPNVIHADVCWCYVQFQWWGILSNFVDFTSCLCLCNIQLGLWNNLNNYVIPSHKNHKHFHLFCSSFVLIHFLTQSLLLYFFWHLIWRAYLIGKYCF